MLSSRERQALKARAHKLEPVVHIGGKGLTEEVLAEIDRALTAHELVKVRAAGVAREEREAALEQICGRTGAQAVQQVGKIFVLFRKNDAQP